MPITYPDLIDALVAHLVADATVAADVGGRVWQGTVGHAEVLPYVLVTDPQDGTTAGLTTAGDYRRDGSYDVHVYAEDPGDGSTSADDLARSIGRHVVAALTDADLTFTAGKLIYLRPGHHDWGEVDPDPGPNGRPVWHTWISVNYIVSGTY
jgi:hypothetical protein